MYLGVKETAAIKFDWEYMYLGVKETAAIKFDWELNKEYVLGGEEAPERISINFE